MSDTLHLEIRPAAPPATVFRALTEEGALRTWLAENAEVSLSEERLAFWGRSTPQGDQPRQRLLDLDQDRRLRLEWTLDGVPSLLEVTLTTEGEGRTILRLQQDGLPTLEELMAPEGRRDGLHTMHTFWSLALANLAEYVEGRALTPGADFRPGRALEVRARLEIDASPAAVYATLVDPAQIERWFGWEVELDPQVGRATTFGLEGTILEVEPDRLLVYADDEGASIRWELEDAGGRTVLTFVQSGYAEDEWDSAAQHEAGWLGSLAELKRLHELGEDWTPLITELPTGSE